MAQDDRLIPHELFQFYRRRLQQPDENKTSANDVVQAHTDILVKEMHLRGLERARNKLVHRLKDLKRVREIVRKEGSDT
jgi:hypothetical protein